MIAKSKINSIETLISQAVIDSEISHKEFKTFINEKEKYEKKNKMKIQKIDAEKRWVKWRRRWKN